MENGEKKQPPEKIVVRIDPDLAELIPGYLANRRKDVTAIRDALKRGDFETAQGLGHTMKGSGGGYGFDVISALGMALEEAAMKRSSEKVNQSAEELNHFLDRVEVIFE